MLSNEFISACKDFVKERSDVLGEEIEDNKKVCKYKITFYNYAVEFRYVKKESTFFKPSALYCVLYLEKNSVVYYHLTDIIPFLEHKTFRSCYFWHIENAERMKSCFKSLTATLENVTSQLGPFLLDISGLSKALFDSYKMIYNLKESDIDFSKIEDPEEYAQSFFITLQNTRDGYIFSRYCSFAPYDLLLTNKIDKALVKYKKLNQKNKLLEYEKHLVDYIENSKNEFRAFDAICDTSAARELANPLNMLKGLFVIFAISSVFFCSIFAIYNLIISIDTLVVLSAPWYLGFLCAGLCSIFGAIALAANRPFASKRLTKKERADFTSILFSKSLKRFASAAFILSFLVSVFFAFAILTANVRFYDNEIRFEDKSYSYDDIDSIYYIDARYNVYDEKIERGSYVILFDDKTSLDLDGFTSIEFTEKEVLPLLKKKGLDIRSAASEKELPWYTE